MKKLSIQLISKLNASTVNYQKEIADRLKLYVFAKSAIQSYCSKQESGLKGYDFKDFKLKFKLIDFTIFYILMYLIWRHIG